MATDTLTPPRSVIDALRGDRCARPAVDTASAAGLRAELEDGIFEILGSVAPATPIVIRSSSLRRVPDATELVQSVNGRLRGVLVCQLLRLLAVGADVSDPFDDAMAAWRSESPSGDLHAHAVRLDADETARLATDVTAHFVTLSRAWGQLPARWTTRSALHVMQRLAGGRVILRDAIDLAIGSTLGDVASVALLDLTTSPLGEIAERALRYHALVQTLRTSVVPLRSAAFSTATGELWVCDVDRDLVARSVRDVLEAVHAEWSRR